MRIKKGDRTYDTETAQIIGEWRPPTGCAERHTLYRKHKGEYFLHFQGNENSRFATLGDNLTTIPGEVISPITEKVAKSWGKEHLPDIVYRREFLGEKMVAPKETSDMDWVAAHIQFRRWQNRLVRDGAKADGKTLAQYIIDAVEMYENAKKNNPIN